MARIPAVVLFASFILVLPQDTPQKSAPLRPYSFFWSGSLFS